jgi:hypothetical protein
MTHLKPTELKLSPEFTKSPQSNDYTIIDKLFDGILIHSDKALFSDFRAHMIRVYNISFIQPTEMELHLLFKNVLILTVSKTPPTIIKSGDAWAPVVVGLYPGFFKDRSKNVFQTYNLALRFFDSTKYIKTIDSVWTLCQTKQVITNSKEN